MTAGPDRVQKSADLFLKGIFLNYFKFFHRKLGIAVLIRFGFPVNGIGAFLGIVDRKIAILLEDAQLPHVLYRNSACGEIGYGPVGKLHSNACNVRQRTEGGNAGSMNVPERGIDDVEHYIDVVNHQIEYYVYFQTSFIKKTEPMGFDEHWIAEARTNSRKCGVEPLQMTDLKNCAALFCRCDKFVGFLQVFCHRFFEKNMHAHREKFPGDSEVLWGGRNDADRIDLADEVPVIAYGLGINLFGHLQPALAVNIDYCNQIGLRQPGIFLSVKTAEVA